ERELGEEVQDVSHLIHPRLPIGLGVGRVLPGLPPQLVVELATLVYEGARPGRAARLGRPAIEAIRPHSVVKGGQVGLAREDVAQHISSGRPQLVVVSQRLCPSCRRRSLHGSPGQKTTPRWDLSRVPYGIVRYGVNVVTWRRSSYQSGSGDSTDGRGATAGGEPGGDVASLVGARRRRDSARRTCGWAGRPPALRAAHSGYLPLQLREGRQSRGGRGPHVAGLCQGAAQTGQQPRPIERAGLALPGRAHHRGGPLARVLPAANRLAG